MTEENKSVKNFPNLRFPGFEGEWKMIRLGELTKLITKGTTPKKFVSEGVKFIKIECFEGNIINSERCLYIDEKVHHKELRRSMLQENDLLFAIAGATIGKTNIITKEILPANTNQALAIIRLNTNENINFIYQILKSDIMQKYIKDSISVGAQPNLNLQQMNDFSFYHPSLSEQNKISSLLISIDERIQTQKKIIEKLKTLMKGSREKIFSQKLRLKDENGNYFSDWRIEYLGNISTITTGSSNRVDSILDGDYTFFDRSQDIRTSSQYLFDKEAIIVPGEGQEFIPKYFVGKFDLHQRTYAIFDFLHINGRFLYYQILSDDRHLQSQAVGSTVKSLRLPMFQSMPIKLPSLKEQIKIANFLSSIQEKIEMEKQILEKLELQKKFLLANLFV